MNTWQNIIDAISDSREDPVDIIIIRNGNKVEKVVKPIKDMDTSRVIIGIEMQERL